MTRDEVKTNTVKKLQEVTDKITGGVLAANLVEQEIILVVLPNLGLVLETAKLRNTIH
jgi:hypothetical protein